MSYLVFSAEGCVPCQKLKEWLSENGVEYTLIDAVNDTKKVHEYGVRSGLPVSIRLNNGSEVERMHGFGSDVNSFFGVK